MRMLDRAGGHRATPVTLPWGEGRDAIARALTATLASAEAAGELPDVVMWAAGRAAPASDAAETFAEVEELSGALDALAGWGRRPGATLVQASSAGAVYAGSAVPPFHEATPPVALSPYGEAKIAAEAAVRGWQEVTGASVVIARIANLYGPGQSMSKAQGLVTAIARAQRIGPPVPLYMPLDTLRDYVYVDDAARLLIACAERAGGTGELTVKVVATGTPVSIARLLGVAGKVTRQRPLVVLASSRLGARQALDLRLASRVWTDLDTLLSTSLDAGIAGTLRAVDQAVQRGTLRAATIR